MNSGLYVRAGACATARLAACAISLFGPTTNDSNVFRGLSPGTVVPGRACIWAGNISFTVESSEAVCALAADGTQNLTVRILPKARTYAAKWLNALFSAFRSSILRACALHRCIEQLSTSLSLTARSFSEMFTTYSQALCGCPASGLETRNQLRNRQEKNQFYFQLQ